MPARHRSADRRKAKASCPSPRRSPSGSAPRASRRPRARSAHLDGSWRLWGHRSGRAGAAPRRARSSPGAAGLVPTEEVVGGGAEPVQLVRDRQVSLPNPAEPRPRRRPLQLQFGPRPRRRESRPDESLPPGYWTESALRDPHFSRSQDITRRIHDDRPPGHLSI